MLRDKEEVRSMIRSAFRVERLNAPADDALIARVERELEVPFPDWLREVYLACDGFTSRADFGLLALDDGENGVLEYTRFLRAEPWWPDWLGRAAIFAGNGLGGSCTIHWGTLDGRLIQWGWDDADNYQVLDCNLYQLLARRQRWLDSIPKT